MTQRSRPVLVLAVLVLLAPTASLLAQDIPDLERKVTVHTLENGWTFIIYERPVAPVFSFATYVDVGSAQEVPGITGLAHMFEHMAFKGTPNIGSKNYKAEKAAPRPSTNVSRSTRRPTGSPVINGRAMSSAGTAANV